MVQDSKLPALRHARTSHSFRGTESPRLTRTDAKSCQVDILYSDRGTTPCCGVVLSVYFVTMTHMSELPAGDTHDVISHSGQVVAVVVPIEEYRQLRQAMQEQHVNEEFDAARANYLTRREAGEIRYVSHEEAGRRLGMPSR